MITLLRLIVVAALLLCVVPAYTQTVFTGTITFNGTARNGPCTTPGPVSGSASLAVTVQPSLSTLVSSGGSATGFFTVTNVIFTGCDDGSPGSGSVNVTVAAGGATTMVLTAANCTMTLLGNTNSASGNANACVGLVTGTATATATAQAPSTTPASLRVIPAALQFTAVAGGGVTGQQAVVIQNDSAFQNNISGVWRGTSTDVGNTSPNATVDLTFVQTGSSVTGAISFTEGGSTSSGSLSGTLVGNSFTFVATGDPGGGYITGQGNLNGNTINGSVVSITPGEPNNSATFTITRQSAAPGALSPLNWTVQASTVAGGSWLTVTPASGTSNVGPQGASVFVTAQTAGLAPGQYTGQIQVSSSTAANSPLVVSVMLTVLPSATPIAAQVRPTGLIFVGGTTAPAAQPVAITTASPATVQASFSATTSSGGAWLVVDRSSASLSTTLNVSVATGTLAAGIYLGQVAVTFSDGSSPQVIQVILVIPASTSAGFKLPVQAACTATRLLAVDRTLGGNFTSALSWPATLEVLVVDDCGVLINNAVAIARFSNGDAQLALQSLGSGRYQSTWRPLNASSSVTVTITVTQGQLQLAQVIVAGKTSDNPNVPAVNPGGMVGGANFTGALSPGAIIAIFGKNLAQAGAADRLPLATEMGGLRITAAGRDLPLFYTSSGQVNAQLPTELASGTRVAVVARVTTGTNSVLTVPEVLNIGPTSPGIFTVTQDGKGQGVIVDASNRLLNGIQASAAPGQVVVIYCSGLGATTPAVASGVGAPSNPLALVVPAPVVNIGGGSAVVQFAGMTPGFAGLYQLNVVVPAGVSGAAVPVSISHQGVTSNTVTMVVR